MAFYRTLTVKHAYIGSDLTNYPVALFGTFAYLATVANGGKVQNANGYDIYFSSDLAGETILPFERVNWQAASGLCEFWIQVPTASSSSDTVIYLQYGGAGSTDLSNPTGVWDSNHVGVYHGGSAASLSLLDSTSNANNGSAIGGAASAASGTPNGGTALGGAISLAGTNYIDCGNAASVRFGGAFTLECWIYAQNSQPGAFSGFIDSYEAASSYRLDQNWSDGHPFTVASNISSSPSVENTGSTSKLTWYYLTAIYDGTNLTCGRDTNYQSSNVGTGFNPGALTAHLTLGCLNTTYYLNGLIDEARISKTNRSQDWLTANYNQIFESDFLTIGSETTGVTIINESFTDSISLSDSVIDQLIIAFSAADSQAGNWGDSVVFNLQIPGIGLSENFAPNWGDSVALEMDYNGIFNDTLALTDGPNQPAKNMNAFIDQFAMSDSQAILVAVALQFNDSFIWTDAVNLVEIIRVLESDSFTWSDAFSFNVPFNRAVSDFFIWRDGQTIAWSSVLPPLTDQFAWSDSIIVANVPFWTPVNEILADTLSLSDSLLYNLAINIGISDTFSPSDSVLVVDAVDPTHQLFQDSFHWGDGVLIIVEGELLQFADQLNLSDSVLVQNATSFDSYIRRYLNDEPA